MLDKATQEEILQHTRNGMRPGAAAEQVGLSRPDFYDDLDDDEEFKHRVDKAEREATEHVEEALYQAAVSGNVTAGRIWLERRDPPKQPGALVPTDKDDDPGFDAELAELNNLAAGGSDA